MFLESEMFSTLVYFSYKVKKHKTVDYNEPNISKRISLVQYLNFVQQVTMSICIFQSDSITSLQRSQPIIVPKLEKVASNEGFWCEAKRWTMAIQSIKKGEKGS